MQTKLSVKILLVAVVAVALLSGRAVFAGETNELHLAIPGSSWSLEINRPDFTIQQLGFSRDGSSAKLTAVNEENGVIMTAFLEKAETPGDAKVCREFYWSKAQQSPMKKDDIKLSEVGPVALVEYTIKGFENVEFNQKNMNAYLSGHGYWVDVHISKTQFKPEDEAVMMSIVKSVRFNDHFEPSVLEWGSWGTFFMSRKNYAEAARCNTKAMELDKTAHVLNRELKVFLLIDLIDCYGNLGDMKKAKELTELGLKKEPGYPAFYYCLACYYAETGDKENALKNLRLAFENKAKLFKGDTLSNPKTDPSFSKYLDDPDFKKFCDGLDE
jgi:tetratricopeptide (TPR) repeat protein